MIDQILARVIRRRRRHPHHVRVAEMAVQIDERRHDRLTGQIHPRGTRRRLDLAIRTKADDAIAVDDED
jgi:hypothetical protein